MSSTVPIIDGHNDVLLRLWLKKSATAALDFVSGDGVGHIDLPRMQQGRMAGGFFAIFSPPEVDDGHDDEEMNPPYAGALSQRMAERSALGMLAIRDEIARLTPNSIALCHSAAEMRNAIARTVVGMITHMEGAEAIKPDLSNLQAYYDKGLRSLGLVWSRPNVFGVGVPFRFPSSPERG